MIYKNQDKKCIFLLLLTKLFFFIYFCHIENHSGEAGLTHSHKKASSTVNTTYKQHKHLHLKQSPSQHAPPFNEDVDDVVDEDFFNENNKRVHDDDAYDEYIDEENANEDDNYYYSQEEIPEDEEGETTPAVKEEEVLVEQPKRHLATHEQLSNTLKKIFHQQTNKVVHEDFSPLAAAHYPAKPNNITNKVAEIQNNR